MRLATFNILSGRSPGDDHVDPDAFAESVRRLDADVLGLQEVDRDQPRTQGLDLTAIAAEAMGAVEHRFLAALSGTPGKVWAAATGDEPVGTPAYGVALLSRHPVRAWREVRLPPLTVPAPYRFPEQRVPHLVRDEQRVALVADLDTPGGPLTVVTTHLSFLPWSNDRQLRLLMRELGGHDDATRLVLAGDLNMGRRRAERGTGLRPLATGKTWPAEAPVRQIDHLLARGDVRSSDGGPLRLPVSDHCALVAELA